MTLQSTIATVNGYRLCYVQDSRFGRLVAVDGTNKAFATIDDAVAFANLAGQFGKKPFALRGRICAGWTNYFVETVR